MNTRVPFYKKDDKALLGFVVYDVTGWQAQTIFGYCIARVTSERDAQRVLSEQGASILTGIWQYFDRDDQQWHACILKDASEHTVTVIRTNDMGYQEPDTYKLYTIKHPTENTLVKA